MKRRREPLRSFVNAAKCVTEGTQGLRVVKKGQDIVLATGSGDKDLRTLSEQERLHGERVRVEELAKLSRTTNDLEKQVWDGEPIITEILGEHVDRSQDDIRDRTLTVAEGATYIFQCVPFQLNPHRDEVYLNALLRKHCTKEFCDSSEVRMIRKILKETCSRGPACHFPTLFPHLYGEVAAGPVAIESMGALLLTAGAHTLAVTSESTENALRTLASFWRRSTGPKLEAGDPEVGAVTRRTKLCLPCILATEELNLTMSVGRLPYANVEGTVGWSVDPVDTNILHQTAVVGYARVKEEPMGEGEGPSTSIPRTNFLASEIHIDDGAKEHGHGRFAHMAGDFTIQRDASGRYYVSDNRPAI